MSRFDFDYMQKITKINEWTIEMVRLSYHHEWLVYKGQKGKEEGEYFKTYKEALQYVVDKIEY